MTFAPLFLEDHNKANGDVLPSARLETYENNGHKGTYVVLKFQEFGMLILWPYGVPISLE